MALKLAIITIPKSMEIDPFYRYKRIVIAPTTTNKNGGATLIPTAQMAALSRQLGRSDLVLTKYISKRVGTGVMVKDDHIHYRKILSAEDIDTIIEEYIIKHVLCSYCENPETMEHDRGRTCKACGETTKS